MQSYDSVLENGCLILLLHGYHANEASVALLLLEERSDVAGMTLCWKSASDGDMV